MFSEPMLSAAVTRTELAATMTMAARARALGADGHDVISLAVGEPDFPTPPHVIEAAARAARDGDTRYPPLAGADALKAAVQRKYARDQKLGLDPSQILVTNGGKQGIFNMIMAVADPRDEVIIPAPAWAGYEQIARFAGATPVFIPCRQSEGFQLAPEALAAAITPRSRLLILNYPNNPSGAGCGAAHLATLAEILRRHPHIWVLSDDIYEHLLFDGAVHTTLAAIAPDLAPRVMTLTGVSKSYAMTGWRVGFCAGSRALIQAMTLVQATATSGVSTIGQAAAVAALEGDQSLLAARRAAYQARRDLVVSALAGIAGMSCHRPEGAFYVYPDVGFCLGKSTPGGTRITDDRKFATALLEEAHVAVVAGAAFALSPHIRISTATDGATLARACARIADFCAALT